MTLRGRPRSARDERGSAVADFVLVMIVLIPLFLGIMQVALVLHVRNTLTSAATEGARFGAVLGNTPADGAERTRREIGGVLAGRYTDRVGSGYTSIDGAPAVEVTACADVPPLGLFGPGVRISVAGHAIQETS